MKLVFVSSPLSGNIKQNIENAKKYCKYIIDNYNDVIPLAPHIYFTQFLDDNSNYERELGMNCGLDLLKKCSEMYVFIDSKFTISEGMKKEIELALELNIPITYINNKDIIMNENDIVILKDVLNYLNNIGLGAIYGNLGRMWAIVHNQLLNDNKLCYSVDKNGKPLVPQLTSEQRNLLYELASCIDDMLSGKKLYTKISNLINKYE